MKGDVAIGRNHKRGRFFTREDGLENFHIQIAACALYCAVLTRKTFGMDTLQDKRDVFTFAEGIATKSSFDNVYNATSTALQQAEGFSCRCAKN